jgi:hypothetical protein
MGAMSEIGPAKGEISKHHPRIIHPHFLSMSFWMKKKIPIFGNVNPLSSIAAAT